MKPVVSYREMKLEAYLKYIKFKGEINAGH